MVDGILTILSTKLPLNPNQQLFFMITLAEAKAIALLLTNK